MQPRPWSNAREAYHIAVGATTRQHVATHPIVISRKAVPRQSNRSPRRWFSWLLLIVIGVGMVGCGPAVSDDPVAAVTVQLDRSVVPLGGPVTMALQFVVSPELQRLNEDLRVMVHFLDSNGDMMWAEDHEPSVPTSQWQPGQTISYTRRARVPMYPYIGDADVAVGLYSPATAERWALTGDPLGERAYRAASVSLEPQSESSLVYYQDGWHSDETDPENNLVWRWTTEHASLSFRNPGSDAVLYLELAGRPDLFETAQRVEVRVGDDAVYEIRLDSEERQFHEIALDVVQLGDTEAVTLDLYVDQTFVPASVPGGSSEDLRNLGIRVFYAFLEPR